MRRWKRWLGAGVAIGALVAIVAYALQPEPTVCDLYGCHPKSMIVN